MSEGMPYADLVILALIAGFVLLRLRNVLGQDDGSRPDFSSKTLDLQADDTVVQITGRNDVRQETVKDEDDKLLAKITDGALRETLDSIKAADSSFSLTHFIQGARGAFEMVFDAFGKGDGVTLQMLLSQPLADEFMREYEARQKQERQIETTLVSIESTEITNAQLIGKIIRLTVRFTSEQVSIARDTKGAIIEGDPAHTSRTRDEWVFEREIGSRNPNWKITDT